MRFDKDAKEDSRNEIKLALEKWSKDQNGIPIIYTVLRSVSRSGMQRRITAFVIVDGVPKNLSWHYDRSHGRMADDSFSGWANKVSGCGMDMGYHLADNIAAIGGLTGYAFRHEWF